MIDESEFRRKRNRIFLSPSINIAEDASDIWVMAELPGMTEKDFRVELDRNRLVISGEKKASREDRRGDTYYSECRYGSFCRSVPLPCEVEEQSHIIKTGC